MSHEVVKGARQYPERIRPFYCIVRLRAWSRPAGRVPPTAVVALLVALGCTGAVAGAATASGEAPAPDRLSIMAVVQARGGSFERAGDGDYTLTLTRVVPTAVWFSDRPARQAGSLSITELIEAFFGGQVPPNAALELVDAPVNRDVFALEISNPRYQRAKQRLALDARLIGDAGSLSSTGLVRQARRADHSIREEQLGAATLFIDHTVTQYPIEDG